MPDILDGQTVEMQGSGSKPYLLKNVGGSYSCSCPAWRNQKAHTDRRTCKHLRKYRGEAAEEARIGQPLSEPVATKKDGPPVLLASLDYWNPTIDPSGWWMSEKLDGVRGFWKNRQFLSRNGNVFRAPDWFTSDIPDDCLDGELWMGRRMFQRTASIVRRADAGDQWKDIRFVVYDAPEVPGPFEHRLAAARKLVSGCKYASEHPHALVTGRDHFLAEWKRVESLGGEGMMLRRPGSFYEAGRSQTLLKAKNVFDDEAVVTGYVAGTRQHKGRTGSLVCRWNGVEFRVGTGLSIEDRERPPAVGTRIKFTYIALSDDGVPKHTAYVGEADE